MTTLADLRARMYSRFDEGALNYISPAEANSLLNEGAAHLHNWIINAAEFYIFSEYMIPLVQGQNDYNLPPDFMKAIKVFSAVPSGNFFPLDRIMPEEFRGYMPAIFSNNPFGNRGAYMILGNKIRIIGVSQAPSVAIWYAPVYKSMVLDTDVPSSAVVPGWEEYIVNHAVIGCRIKEESDTTQLERRQAGIMKMIEESIINRDMGRNQHVVDISHGV